MEIKSIYLWIVLIIINVFDTPAIRLCDLQASGIVKSVCTQKKTVYIDEFQNFPL